MLVGVRKSCVFSCVHICMRVAPPPQPPTCPAVRAWAFPTQSASSYAIPSQDIGSGIGAAVDVLAAVSRTGAFAAFGVPNGVIVARCCCGGQCAVEGWMPPPLLAVGGGAGTVRVISLGVSELAVTLAAAAGPVVAVFVRLSDAGLCGPTDLCTSLDNNDWDDGAVWTRLALVTPVPGSSSSFGGALAIFGSVLVVGDPSGGVVTVYSRSGRGWTVGGAAAPPPGAATGGFGGALSLDADLLVVGAPGGWSGGDGAVFVYSAPAVAAGAAPPLCAVEGSGALGTAVAHGSFCASAVVVAGAPGSNAVVAIDVAMDVNASGGGAATCIATERVSGMPGRGGGAGLAVAFDRESVYFEDAALVGSASRGWLYERVRARACITACATCDYSLLGRVLEVAVVLVLASVRVRVRAPFFFQFCVLGRWQHRQTPPPVAAGCLLPRPRPR
jgi:hypothetical protein